LTERYVCIHGHFYQPPRENPWTGSVDVEGTASPWHDWNQRITDECYAPNAGPPSNYERLSFDVGPTLMRWLERERPDVYRAIVAGDGDNQGGSGVGGRGGAMAQAYSHMIMPLANDRDRRTQVRWGAADFEHRFGRRPDGMWLPETAVDLATLEALVDEGVRFTVLAPHQADRVRVPQAESWAPARDGLDAGQAYRQVLPSGRDIAVFFYDGPLSRAVAFGGLLDSGDEYAGRLAREAASGPAPRLVSVATDGESYGHHHPHGEKALARAIQILDRDPRVQLTTFASYLDKYPPRAQVQIAENTSWSCVHGVSRWTGECGCGDVDGAFDVPWRGALRGALDGLRESLAAYFERAGSEVLRDPWSARDDYIACLLDPAPEAREAFLAVHMTADGSADEAIRLLEQQRYAMLMFTSCGWFFGDPEGLEPRQVLRYAIRALDLSAGLPEAALVATEFRQALGSLGPFFDRVLGEHGPAALSWISGLET